MMDLREVPEGRGLSANLADSWRESHCIGFWEGDFLPTVRCIFSFLFGNLETYLYLCKKITYTPCYKIVKIMERLNEYLRNLSIESLMNLSRDSEGLTFDENSIIRHLYC